jgi:hypothetical protein
MVDKMVLLPGAAIVVTVVLIRYLPVFQSASALLAIMRRTQGILRRGGASDHWKEKAAAGFAARMFAATTRFAFLLALAMSPLAIAWVVAGLLSIDRLVLLTNWPVRIALVVAAIATNMIINAFRRRSL